ncbi:hypothetical protein N7490_009784 [Penicillium lividum]|nr:hypothetical protein N7490_009784 [Penicillium lividum]
MTSLSIIRVIVPLLLAGLVAGHGHISNIVINGVYYDGWDIDSFPYESDPPTVVAWGTPNTGNGFISPDQYSSSDIICHENATNAKGYATIAAGDKINLQWTAWPDSHHGPVLTYLANCGDSCETVDKTTLEFFKISGVGLVSETDVPGTWGDDQLISNDNSWLVEIPPTLQAGYYVLRNEIIALHSAEESDGAQNYPQCFNLQVTGTGTESPSGVLGTELYSATDAGILVNIYSSLSTYEVPGPTLYSGAVSVTQSTSAITSTGTATTGSGDSIQATTSTDVAAMGTSIPSTNSPVSSTTSTTSAEVSEPVTSVELDSTSSPTVFTTASSSIITTAPSSTSITAVMGSAQSLYGQCGGVNWTGATACTTQAVCSSMNPYYYQCVASAA